jgi:hypothetical protein
VSLEEETFCLAAAMIIFIVLVCIAAPFQQPINAFASSGYGFVKVEQGALNSDLLVGAAGWFLPDDYMIVYQEKTGVMYSMSIGNNNRGTLTRLDNPDGTPLIWNGE